jgi:hypothetical protein
MKLNKKLKKNAAINLSNLEILKSKYLLAPEKQEHHYVSFLLLAIALYAHKKTLVEPYLNAAQSFLHVRKQKLLSSFEPGLIMASHNQDILSSHANLSYAKLYIYLAKWAACHNNLHLTIEYIDDALVEFKYLKYLNKTAKHLYIEAIDLKIEHQSFSCSELKNWLDKRKKLCTYDNEKMLHHQHSGHLYFMQDCFKKAISSFSKSLYYYQKQTLEIDQSIIFVHQSLAVCYLYNKQYIKGVPHLEVVVNYYQDLFQSDQKFYFDDYLERLKDLAYLYSQAKMFDKADQVYQTCFKHYEYVYRFHKTHANELKSLLEDMLSFYLKYKQHGLKKQIEAVIMQLDL